jgi:hypothetical protein
MTSDGERTLVRFLVGVALFMALLLAALSPVPEGAPGDPSLPAIALGQANLYRLELALLTFYGSLLLATPAFSGLIRGRLPTEISTQGAKFASEADESAEKARTAIKKLEQITDDLAEGLVAASLKIERLENRPGATVRNQG